FVAVNAIGVRPVTLCAPSQYGWLALRPQAHQKYFRPASTLTAYGAFCAGMASLINSSLWLAAILRCGRKRRPAATAAAECAELYATTATRTRVANRGR